MGNLFKKATKKQAKLRLCLIAPPGAGKTYSALAIANGLCNDGDEIAVIDTEHGSAAKYSDKFNFDVVELSDFAVKNYIEAMKAAADGGYKVLVIDSLSHAWAGVGGVLDAKTKMDARGGNSFQNWGKMTPLLNQLVEGILSHPAHVIVTLRSKVEHVMEKDERGKTTIKKVGMAPVMRDGIEYEFDVVGDITQDHDFIITKSRCPALDGNVYNKPNGEVSGKLREWLDDGVPLTQEEKDNSAYQQQVKEDVTEPPKKKASEKTLAEKIAAARDHKLFEKLPPETQEEFNLPMSSARFEEIKLIFKSLSTAGKK